MDLKDIGARVKSGKRVSPDEFAYLISNDREAFMAFLIANNPGSMNNILRHKLGYTHELGFAPDAQKLSRLVQVILDRGNEAEIKTIIDNFKVNLNGISPELQRAIQVAFKDFG
jgi:hypothetical protein